MCEGYSKMLTSQFEIHPQTKLKSATVRKFVKVNADIFLSKAQMKKKNCIISSEDRRMIEKAGIRSSFCTVNVRALKNLLARIGSMAGVDKIPMQEEYENAFESDMDPDRKIMKICALNEFASEA